MHNHTIILHHHIIHHHIIINLCEKVYRRLCPYTLFSFNYGYYRIRHNSDPTKYTLREYLGHISTMESNSRKRTPIRPIRSSQWQVRFTMQTLYCASSYDRWRCIVALHSEHRQTQRGSFDPYIRWIAGISNNIDDENPKKRKNEEHCRGFR